MMNTFSKKSDYDKFVMIIEAALITKKKSEEVLETLRAISDFEDKLHYEKVDTMNDLEKRNLKQQTKTTINEVESNSQELALTYLPYWDTKIGGNSKEADTKKALEWFELTPIEAHNVCKRINCFTFREFIMYYRTNLRLFTISEVAPRQLDERTEQKRNRRCAHHPFCQTDHVPFSPVDGFSSRNQLDNSHGRHQAEARSQPDKA